MYTLHGCVRMFSAMVRQKKYKIINIPLISDTVPTLNRGFRLEVIVNHEQKMIKFVSEGMSNYEKLVIYARHKKTMKHIYPEYRLSETHS